VLGPAPAPLFRLRDKTRYRFLVKAPKNFPLQAYLRDWMQGVRMPSSVRAKVDVDPYSFL
jgi:primosomal protein N' (replication factor Y)